MCQNKLNIMKWLLVGDCKNVWPVQNNQATRWKFLLRLNSALLYILPHGASGLGPKQLPSMWHTERHTVVPADCMGPGRNIKLQAHTWGRAPDTRAGKKIVIQMLDSALNCLGFKSSWDYAGSEVVTIHIYFSLFLSPSSPNFLFLKYFVNQTTIFQSMP